MGTKIVIDTNKLLDFYRASRHPRKVLMELSALSSELVWPNQVIDEFKRNRASTLNRLKKDICEGPLVSLPKTALLDDLAEATELRQALEQVAEIRGKLKKRIELFVNEGNDPISTEFQRMLEAGTRISLTPEIIDRAHYRMLRGAPPSSPERHSIGDEIIYESLFEIGDDVLFVTGDSGFLAHGNMLSDEFHRRTGRLLTFTSDLSSAMKELGKPADAIEEAEDEAEEQQFTIASKVVSSSDLRKALETLSSRQFDDDAAAIGRLATLLRAQGWAASKSDDNEE